MLAHTRHQLTWPQPPQAVYAPSIATGRNVIAYEDAIINMTNTMFRDFNTSLNAYKSLVEANQLPTLTPDMWAAYNKTINESSSKMRNLTQAQSEQRAWALLHSRWPGLCGTSSLYCLWPPECLACTGTS